MPTIPVPDGAVDCHVHVFDPARFRFAADVSYRPLPSECGTAEDLGSLLDTHGIARVVVVNPTSGYGDDNACMLDALERLGPRARGIARVPVSIAVRDLDALARRGVVGVRIDFVALGLAPLHDPAFARLLTALADRDLVLDMQAQGDQWSAIVAAIGKVPVRAVVDHMGRPRPEHGVEAPGFRALLGLASTGRVAVKLSGRGPILAQSAALSGHDRLRLRRGSRVHAGAARLGIRLAVSAQHPAHRLRAKPRIADQRRAQRSRSAAHPDDDAGALVRLPFAGSGRGLLTKLSTSGESVATCRAASRD